MSRKPSDFGTLKYDLSASVHALAQGYKPDRLGVSGKNDFE